MSSLSHQDTFQPYFAGRESDQQVFDARERTERKPRLSFSDTERRRLIEVRQRLARLVENARADD